MRFQVLIAWLGLFAFPISGLAASDSGHEWSVQLESEAKWQRATPAGVLVLGTKSGVIGLEGASGKILWHIDDLRDPDDISFDALPHSPYGLLGLKKGMRGKIVRIVIDVTTGHEIWDSSALGLLDAYH